MITLKTLSQATEQEVFEQSSRHLLAQNARSAYLANCYYRTRNGLKCAAGIFMSDEEYRREYEENIWSELVNNIPDIFTSAHKELIIRLQQIHDNKSTHEWKGELIVLGEMYGLNHLFIGKEF